VKSRQSNTKVQQLVLMNVKLPGKIGHMQLQIKRLPTIQTTFYRYVSGKC